MYGWSPIQRLLIMSISGFFGCLLKGYEVSLTGLKIDPRKNSVEMGYSTWYYCQSVGLAAIYNKSHPLYGKIVEYLSSMSIGDEFDDENIRVVFDVPDTNHQCADGHIPLSNHELCPASDFWHSSVSENESICIFYRFKELRSDVDCGGYRDAVGGYNQGAISIDALLAAKEVLLAFLHKITCSQEHQIMLRTIPTCTYYYDDDDDY